ncbi:hypothetical protein EYF80_041097 [Liparis tanakae]|uniref:Uncharacterized protein n=1 Tax=Liparis tanakae TaxID=230148 RepID=A0A4Z2G5C7_9TELE|nr:hypothetical protein EYF80_041097 [Liparis tanakae]
MDGSPCNIKAPCLAMPTGATPLRGSRPPGFPAIGSSLKVTLQSGHADAAGLAVGMEPAPPLPLLLLLLFPPTIHSTPPHTTHHLKDTAPTPAGPRCLSSADDWRHSNQRMRGCCPRPVR